MMDPLFRKPVHCPHCGCLNQVNFPLHGAGIPQLILCEPEEGGCDQWFAITATVRVVIEPTVHRIEGVGQPVDRTARDEDGGAR
jgi:hypothetical protein